MVLDGKKHMTQGDYVTGIDRISRDIGVVNEKRVNYQQLTYFIYNGKEITKENKPNVGFFQALPGYTVNHPLALVDKGREMKPYPFVYDLKVH